MNLSYTCKCGRVNKFGIWVLAHWDLRLIGTCECGRKNEILRGRVVKWGKLEEKPNEESKMRPLSQAD